MLQIVWMLPLLGSIIAGFEFFNSMASATSAPQQAAGAAMAMCWAVPPYILARAYQEIAQRNAEEARGKIVVLKPGDETLR